ncbi:tRNA (5-methylaminomethyl-2-thiouridine)(34)-methyltransferase MnmD [Porphyromonas cangingivalis]|uniref:tRNA U34 5-methylaminomethyl-2-thiouridine-forming methyltransferase MnmC n=1 Tax=Porphyromonas cangingivalis TaxID=36874 RepID=A0A1T4KYP1_PORCN|nr:tRNA (5-methylaminomethyl-2-thiouridine)(34)-methyltransferase MnmD [Porphyromonas cangingivalis]SJZ47572.1 tRNA U34 5-methylaminomethyl-2-thiouridine-forming methyltransferase MnmC [Porphyromonas cangingivalis]VEJ04031.1 tRNA 5-methylaminomethyl-2-thiouridine biosynthesis bifunctional protein MnmC [Porphyromonas cangingivalis]
MTASPTHKIERTQDGSTTLYNEALDEHYHSCFGARAESLHVFIDNALVRGETSPKSVLEIGFGTGLNALLSLLHTERHPDYEVLYTTYELFPISDELAVAFANSFDETERSWLRRLHAAPWGEVVEITPRFRLHKIQADARSVTPPTPLATAVYMDAFSPEKCPELWEIEQLRRLYDCCASGAYLSTYCAKGAVRRAFQSVGFEVFRTPGPPGGKREILVCHKP